VTRARRGDAAAALAGDLAGFCGVHRAVGLWAERRGPEVLAARVGGRGVVRILATAVLDAGARTVLVGPEGGWSPEELADADAGGAGRCTLGPHVLRAETAAIVAGALLVTLRASG
jgi:hypothetical protein